MWLTVGRGFNNDRKGLFNGAQRCTFETMFTVARYPRSSPEFAADDESATVRKVGGRKL